MGKSVNKIAVVDSDKLPQISGSLDSCAHEDAYG